MRPGAQELRCADRSNAGLVEQDRRRLLDERLELGFQFRGLGPQREGAASRSLQRQDRVAQLDGIGWFAPEPRATLDEGSRWQRVQQSTQSFRCTDDQVLQLADRLGARAHRVLTRGEQYAQCFTSTSSAGLGQVFAGQRLASGSDGIELVGLGAVAARRTLGAVDLDDRLVVLEEIGGEPGAEAPRAFDRPDTAPTSVLIRERQQAPTPGCVSGDR